MSATEAFFWVGVGVALTMLVRAVIRFFEGKT